MKVFADHENSEQDGRVTSHFAIFDKEFADKIPDMTDFGLLAEIHDRETGKTFQCKHAYNAVQETCHWKISEPVFCLHVYLYASHWCGCHRMDDIQNAGHECHAIDGNECPDDRFIVKKMWHPDYPEHTLMYETYTESP